MQQSAQFSHQIYLSHPHLSEKHIEAFNLATNQKFAFTVATSTAIPTAVCKSNSPNIASLRAVAKNIGIDISVAPFNRSIKDFKLAAFDMDSTLITIECIDEIADYIGKKAEVAAITDAAMRGEIADYQESLRRRVALLKGLQVDALQRVYDERLKLTDGAEKLIQFLQQAGVKILLVSGGFTFFTEKLKDRLKLDFARSNQLEVLDGKLTGGLIGAIVDADVKRDTVLATCAALGISPQETIAVGDGANDLKMMSVAGMSVAFHAKPIVQEQASDAINYTGLDTMTAWLNPR
jgi:phosphoserine phosphatase